jgi:hypothetical protein
MGLFFVYLWVCLTFNIQMSDSDMYTAVRPVYCAQSCLDWLQPRGIQRRRVYRVRIVVFWLFVGCMNDVWITESPVLRDRLFVTVVALVQQK